VSSDTVTGPNEALEGLPGSEHEDIVVTHRATSGLRAMIAVHSTLLGPSLGGARF
jgi:glutamate dehydrogenase/leucine dehydrogenase